MILLQKIYGEIVPDKVDNIQAADGTSCRWSPSPVDRYSFVIAFRPLLSLLLSLLFAQCVWVRCDFSAGSNWNRRVFDSSGPPARRDEAVMALGALDLLLVADCAWIWVRSEIRDPPEASTHHCHPRLCSAVSPQSVYSSSYL
ncbi:hypothetical protein YC2023_014939 [Brassica napus]